ncbi:MAG: DUF692 family protein [Anaerolineae bacterium]
MKFALNYSPEAAALLDEKLIHIDLYKCAAWDDMIATASQQLPVYVHFPLMTAYGVEMDLERVEKLRTQTQTPYVNMHLSARASLFDRSVDAVDDDFARRLHAAMLADIQQVSTRFGCENVILENVPWDPEYEIPLLVISPQFARTMIETSECGLLLDLVHARIAAIRLGVDVYEYLEQLPTDRLREVHVTGMIDDKGYLRDHFPMTAEDWAIFEYAMARIRAGDWRTPDIVACEYGGIGPMFEWRSKRDVIAAEIPRMWDAVHAE